MQNSILKFEWLFPLKPITKTKLQPITALINRSTYHKIAKGSPKRASNNMVLGVIQLHCYSNLLLQLYFISGVNVLYLALGISGGILVPLILVVTSIYIVCMVGINYT